MSGFISVPRRLCGALTASNFTVYLQNALRLRSAHDCSLSGVEGNLLRRVKELVVKMVSGLFFLLLMAVGAFAHAETYRWTDDRGVVHFTDDYARIPVKDRSRASMENYTTHVNVMPSEKLYKKVKKAPVNAPKVKQEKSSPEADRQNTDREERRFFEHRKHRHETPPLVIPTTPARKAQEKNEEQLRKNRQLLDDTQLPARKAQEQNEEQIRKIREGISGH